MPVFIDPSRRSEYVLKAQRSEKPEDQVRFLLRVMTAREWARMSAEEVADAKKDGRGATGADSAIALLKYGCEGWKAAEGQPASTLDADGRLSQASIDMIPAHYRDEIADAVWRLNNLFETDVGFSQ